MEKREELNLFIARVDELIESKYVLADIKISNLLKGIVSLESIYALFKSCLIDFDYETAKKKYLVSAPYLMDNKGEYLLPNKSKELLAFTLNVLTDMDSGTISLAEFLDKYFYEDGSYISSYSSFINKMIKPFKSAVKLIMDSVLEGKIEDPIEVISRAEELAEKSRKLEEEKEKEDRNSAAKLGGESKASLKEILLNYKKNIKERKRLKNGVKEELVLVIDKLANSIDGGNVDEINYSFIAYKNSVKLHPVIFFSKKRKVKKLVGDILNGLN